MMFRRAQGISVNVIIIAAIALVVMVILIALVLNAFGKTGSALNACSGIGGIEGQQWKCIMTDPEIGCGYGWTKHPTRKCDLELPNQELIADEDRRTCCIPTG